MAKTENGDLPNRFKRYLNSYNIFLYLLLSAKNLYYCYKLLLLYARQQHLLIVNPFGHNLTNGLPINTRRPIIEQYVICVPNGKYQYKAKN